METDHPSQLIPLQAERDHEKLDQDRLTLDAPCQPLVRADDVLVGLQVGDLILAAVYGITRIER